jgi:PII-like signaling protein
MKYKLTIYQSNTDRYRQHPLYMEIAQQAQQAGLSGITAYQGIMGYGSSSKLRNPLFWEFNLKYPVVIEAIDDEERLREFIKTITPVLESVPKGIMATLQPVEIVYQQFGKKL